MKLLIDVNQLLWNGPILVMLFGTHVYFTLRLRLVQRKIGYGISLSLSDGSKNKKGFGRFGSLTTTLAATLGTGNIIGISTAVFLGGPGAVFWCWLTGLLGMATTYAETFLCHHFRYQGHGGPMYILHFLLHKKTLALLYSAALTLSAFFIGCTTQSNAITETCHQVFSLPPATCAIITAFFVGLILMQGRKWIENVCQKLEIPTKSNRVDIGVRVELPAVIFSHLTDELYESKIVYRTEKFEDLVRTFCMNPNGIVVNENTNGIVTVNGHSYEGAEKQTENTNFALLVAKHFSEPFKDSNGYGESIARLSNMLGGGVIVQRFGDLMRGRRSTEKRIEEGLVKPTLAATPGDLSLVLPKRILDGIIEMIYALDKIAPGTANDDTLLYGVEVKFYNMEVEIDNNLETRYKGLYIIGDGSGVTHSLSHASASGVYVARKIIEEM